MPADLNILVISDVHAFNGAADDGQSPSYYSIWPQYQNSDLRNPFRTIPSILSKENLAVDWIYVQAIWRIALILPRKRELGQRLSL